MADKTLVDKGIVGDQSYYKFAGRRNPADSPKKVFAPRLGFAFRPLSDDKTVVRGGYGIFWDSAEGREIDGAADIFPYVSRGNYIQSIGQSNLRTTDQMFPNFAGSRCHSCRQYLSGGEHVAGTRKPVCPAMVTRRAAFADDKHHLGTQLYWVEGHAPADATSTSRRRVHQPILRFVPQSHRRRLPGSRTAAIPEFRYLH